MNNEVDQLCHKDEGCEHELVQLVQAAAVLRGGDFAVVDRDAHAGKGDLRSHAACELLHGTVCTVHVGRSRLLHPCIKQLSKAPRMPVHGPGSPALQRGQANYTHGVDRCWGGCGCKVQGRRARLRPGTHAPMKIWEMWKAQARITAATMKRMPEYCITRVRPWYLQQADA